MIESHHNGIKIDGTVTVNDDVLNYVRMERHEEAIELLRQWLLAWNAGQSNMIYSDTRAFLEKQA